MKFCLFFLIHLFLLVPVSGDEFPADFNLLQDKAKIQKLKEEGTLISTWEALLNKHSNYSHIGEMQYDYYQRIIMPQGPWVQKKFLKPTIENYHGPKNNYGYLMLLSDYSFYCVEPGFQTPFFRSILDQLDQGLIDPLPRWGISKDKAIELLLYNSIWGELNADTTGKSFSEKFKAANEMRQTLQQRPRSGQLIRVLGEWETEVARHMQKEQESDQLRKRQGLPVPDSSPLISAPPVNWGRSYGCCCQ